MLSGTEQALTNVSSLSEVITNGRENFCLLTKKKKKKNQPKGKPKRSLNVVILGEVKDYSRKWCLFMMHGNGYCLKSIKNKTVKNS